MTNELPFFSIVIPTYRRSAPLAACLEAIARLDYPHDRFEVIVVDDGSDELSEEVIAPFYGQFDLRWITQSHGGPAKARNTGAAQSRGEFLAFVDDDCLPAADWLSALAARSASCPGHLIGGGVLNGLSANPYADASQTLSNLTLAYFNSTPNPLAYVGAANLTAPTTQFLEIGGFDATLTTAEDRELCSRWQSHGYLITYAPEAIVYHRCELTLRRFLRQQLNYGRGGYKYYQMLARCGTGHFSPNTQLYIRILSYPFRTERVRLSRRLELVALLMISQAAITTGFLLEWLRVYPRTGG